MLPQRSQEIADPAFGGKDAVCKSEALRIIGIAVLGEMAERFGTIPMVRDLPTEKQEERQRVERFIAACGDPAEPLRQHRAQAVKINQAQNEIEITHVRPGHWMIQVGRAAIDVVRAIRLLGTRGVSGGVDQRKGNRSRSAFQLQAVTKVASWVRCSAAVSSAFIAPSAGRPPALLQRIEGGIVGRGVPRQEPTECLRMCGLA